MTSLLSFVVMVGVWCQSTMAIRVSIAFKNAGIIPDIIPMAPRDILEVYYATSSVCLGSEIPHTHTTLSPSVEYDARRGMNYTLMMIDPDLPTAATPAYRSTLHGLLVNVPGENLQPRDPNALYVPGKNVLGGKTIAPYLPVIFYPGSGYHRIIFLLYAQTRTLDVSDRNLLQLGIARLGFSLADFVKQYDMGELVAGNYFVSSLDTNERFCRAT